MACNPRMVGTLWHTWWVIVPHTGTSCGQVAINRITTSLSVRSCGTIEMTHRDDSFIWPYMGIMHGHMAIYGYNASSLQVQPMPCIGAKLWHAMHIYVARYVCWTGLHRTLDRIPGKVSMMVSMLWHDMHIYVARYVSSCVHIWTSVARYAYICVHLWTDDRTM